MKKVNYGSLKYVFGNLISKNITYLIIGLIIVTLLYSIGFMLLDINDALSGIMDSNLLGYSYVEVKNADKEYLNKEYIYSADLSLKNINLMFINHEPINANSVNLEYKNILKYLEDNSEGEFLLNKDDNNTNAVLISNELMQKLDVSLNDSVKFTLMTNLKGGNKEVEFKIKGVFDKNSESKYEGENFFKNVDIIYDFNFLSNYVINNYEEFPAIVYFETPSDLLKCFFNESLHGDYVLNDFNNFYGEYKTLSYLNFFLLFLSALLIICGVLIFFNLNKFMIHRAKKKIGILKTYGASDEQISYSFFFIFQCVNILAIGIYLIFSKTINFYSNNVIENFYSIISIRMNYFYIIFLIIVTVIASCIKTLSLNKKLQKISIVEYLALEE